MSMPVSLVLTSYELQNVGILMSFRRDVYSMTTCSEWGWVQYLYRQLGVHLKPVQTGSNCTPTLFCKIQNHTAHNELQQQKPTHDDVSKIWQHIIMSTISNQSTTTWTTNETKWKQNGGHGTDEDWQDMGWMWNRMKQTWSKQNKTNPTQTATQDMDKRDQVRHKQIYFHEP